MLCQTFSVPSLRPSCAGTLVALGVAFAMVSCSSRQPAAQEPMISVQAATVRRTTIQQEVTAQAILYPLHQAAIVPKIAAPVLKFYVNRGDRVRAGQLLAVLENKDLAASVSENNGVYEQAQANYASAIRASLPEQIQAAQSDLKNANAALQAAQRLLNSSKNLYQQGALAKRQLDQAEVGFVQAQTQQQAAKQRLQKLQSVGKNAQRQAAQGQLEEARGRYQGAEAQFAYSEIHSPIDGVVTDRPFYPGEMAAPGSPLITVMETSRIVARAHIPEEQAQLLKAGDPANLVAAGIAGEISGKVTLVSPALDPNSTTVEVWVEAPNSNGQLRPGATAKLTIISRTVADAIVIPKAALLANSSGGNSVMVVGPERRAHERQVETGIQEGAQAQIVKGLSAGEVVVTSGAYGLPDNARVNIEKTATGGAE